MSLPRYRISNGVYAIILDETAEIRDNWTPAADVAELADAQASGACGLRLVEVRLLSSAFSTPLLAKYRLFAHLSKAAQIKHPTI